MNAARTPSGSGLGFRVGDIVSSAGGRYRIRGFLGRGGMAHVLEVEDEELGKRFALKILDAHLADDPASVERFEREARALAKLDHPNLVAVVRLERTQDRVPRPFFLMERLRGGTLRDHLNRGVVGLERTLAITSDLLGALDYVHERKLLHRDVKPSNVFVHMDAFGAERAKLLDFGVMKLLLEEDAATGFFGTAHYAAPEQLEAGGTLGPASDVFAAGIVLFESLTGVHPFATQERTPRGARDARLRGAPALADRVTGDLVPHEIMDELSPLVAALLARDPHLRPSAGTASRALARIGRKLSSLAADGAHVLSARTAVPLPFLPGHLAAPTLIDPPRAVKPAAFQTLLLASRTVPMPPPPAEDKTESVADAELLPTRPVLILVPPPPPDGVRVPSPASTTRTIDRAYLPSAPTSKRGPNGTERLAPEANPMHVAAPPGPPRANIAPLGTPLAERGPTSSLATKVLVALAILAVLLLLAVAGKRPRPGSARPSAHGVAAGTTSPPAKAELHALR